MSTTGKEYKLAIRIAGIIDKSFNASLTSTKGSLAKFKATINAMDKDFTKLDKGFNGIMKTGKKCFSAIATAAGVAAVAVGAATAASIAVGSEFESAFTGVKKTVDATEEEYAKLRQDILDMTHTIPSSASDIAGVMEIAGQLGIATDSLTDFTETMINLGVSTNLSAEDAATNLARFANVVSMADYDENGISNWERLGSVIVDLGNNFATTEADIVEMGTRLASTGTLVGLTESQIMALSTAMSSVGIQAESGGSTMAKLLKKMQLAVELNSDALAQYASVANMTGEQFTQAFQDDAVVALSAFIDGLNDTERNGKSAIAILDDMGLSEVRLSNTILALASADGVMSSAIETANKAWSENTALATEAGKRYETAESKVQLMKNAFSELGITAYEELREPFVDVVDTITKKVSNLNDYIGGADGISKWIKKINTTLPTLKRQAKNAWKAVSPLLDGIVNVGEWLLKNPDVIVGTLVGIGSALATYKIASTLVHTVNAIMQLTTMNPATQGIMTIVTAIGALSAICAAAEAGLNKLANQNLSDHFGSIALSMEDIQKVAEYIVSSDSLGGVRKALEAFEDLDGISSTMESAISEIDKMNWKVNIGMELTPDEQESYKEAIDEYVQQAQEYALQSQYAVQANLSIGLDGADADTMSIADKINGFYADCYNEMTELGQDLSAAVNDAFSDSILDPDEIIAISDIQAKMAELQESMATGEFEAQLSAIGLKYSGQDLTAESFQDLQSELNQQVETASEAYQTSYAKNYASAKAALDAGSITTEEFAKVTDELQQKYIDNLNALTEKAAAFQLNTIDSQYMPDISGYAGGAINGDLDWLKDQMEYTKEQLAMMDYDPLEEYFFGLSKDLIDDSDFEVVRKAVSKLLEEATPTIEQMEDIKSQCEAAGKAVPESIADGLEQYDFLQGVADGSIDAMYKAIGMSISGTEYADIIQELAEQGRSIPQSLLDGIESGTLEGAASAVESNIAAAAENTVKPAAEGMYAWSEEYIDEYYSKGFTASADVSITLNPLYNWNNTSLPALSGLSALSGSNYSSKLDIKHNANGGIWDKPILTTFAENSPEAAIPIDGSQNAINLWEQTGKLLGMDSVLDNVSLEGGNGPVIEYSPVLKFYGEAPSKDDISEALSISKDEFENLMARYLKDNGRVSFA